MDNKSKSNDVLSGIDPVEFVFDETSSSGFTAQEISSVLNDTITITGGQDYTMSGQTITLDPGSLNWSTNYTIGIGAVGSNGSSNTVYDKDEIKLGNGKRIDLEELADVIETMKKRLLILAPNFEMHEKYPMLKELYDEYKAMEKLLSGPDNDMGDM